MTHAMRPLMCTVVIAMAAYPTPANGAGDAALLSAMNAKRRYLMLRY